jgi:hypothetical protein
VGVLAFFKAVKRVVTGEVVRQIDITANGGITTMSLRLKRVKGSGEHYVVLAGLSEGNYQYFAFTRDEFDCFSRAVRTIDDSLTHSHPHPAI